MQEKNRYREILFAYKDTKYQKFTSALIPNCNNIIGVKIPVIRKLAKEVIKDNNVKLILESSDSYFEETMLRLLVIANLKNIEDVLFYTKQNINKITNWSLCDTFCCELKIARKNQRLFWGFLQNYFQSKNAFEIRFAVVMIISHFISKEYITQIFVILDSIKNNDYYVKMAVGWTISVCFVKFPEQTFEYLQNNKLGTITHNIAIKKICESLRVDRLTKEKVKKLKK